MSGQSAEPTEPATRRSARPRLQGLLSGLPPGLPGFPSGLPWWGATLLAVTATAVGLAYDAGAGNKELGAVFSTFYVLGCLAAVLLVRRSGLFTAVIQPPLILFIAVPTAYFLFHGGQLGGLKDILINCGYPLIERFPLMFFTSAAVLLVGMARWYFDRGASHGEDAAADVAPPVETPRRAARRFAGAALPVDGDDEIAKPRRPRREPADPYERPRRPRTAEPSHARHNRPPESDIAASAAAADRRERAAARERSGRPRRQGEPPADPAHQPRRAREPRDPREPRRTPPPTRGAYDSPDPYERPRRRPGPDGYEPGYGARPDDRADPYQERPRRSASDSSHHPVSRVRYRSTDEERHTEHRARPRNGHHRDSDY